MDRSKEEHPMIDIKGGRGVTIEDAATSGKRVLSAEDVSDLRVKGVFAGVNPPGKTDAGSVWVLVGKALLGIISSLVVAFLVYKFGWN